MKEWLKEINWKKEIIMLITFFIMFATMDYYNIEEYSLSWWCSISVVATLYDFIYDYFVKKNV